MSRRTKVYKIFEYNSRLRKNITQKKKKKQTIVVAKHYLFVYITYYLFIKKLSNLLISVLDKTKKVSVVCDSITKMFFRAPGPYTKLFKRFFLYSFNKKYIINVFKTSLGENDLLYVDFTLE